MTNYAYKTSFFSSWIIFEILMDFNSGSFDVQTDTLLSAVWQLAAFKDTLTKQCPCKSVKIQIHHIFKIHMQIEQFLFIIWKKY